MPFPAPVIDMVLLDPQQPRGLIFAVRRIVRHLEVLPALRPDGRADVPLRLGRQIRARIEGLDAEEMTGEAMEELVDLLARLSDAIGRRYFLQEGRPFPRNGGMLLA
jgi:uncharacterized alpha-E superfamily protein